MCMCVTTCVTSVCVCFFNNVCAVWGVCVCVCVCVLFNVCVCGVVCVFACLLVFLATHISTTLHLRDEIEICPFSRKPIPCSSRGHDACGLRFACLCVLSM